jgi:hypothetical protein
MRNEVSSMIQLQLTWYQIRSKDWLATACTLHESQSTDQHPTSAHGGSGSENHEEAPNGQNKAERRSRWHMFPQYCDGQRLHCAPRCVMSHTHWPSPLQKPGNKQQQRKAKASRNVEQSSNDSRLDWYRVRSTSSR